MNGWIVAHTMVIYDSRGRESHHDYWNVFIEYNESEESPEEQARNFYKELTSGQHDNDEQEMYSASLAEIKESSETHYTNIDE